MDRRLDRGLDGIISLKDKDGALEEIAIANGTASSHAVTKAQLDASASQKLSYISTTVTYNGGNVSIGTAAANTTVQKIVVEKGSGNWTGHNDTTEITVGDNSDIDRLFAGFDPDGGQHQIDKSATCEACCTRGMVTTRHKMLSVTSHYGATCVHHYSSTPWSYVIRLHRRTQGTPVSAPVKSARVTPRRWRVVVDASLHWN